MTIPSSKLTPTQRAFVLTFGAALVAAPWMIGTAPVWAQLVELSLCVASLLAAVADRFSSNALSRQAPHARLLPWAVAAVVVFLGLLWIQTWNKSMEVVFSGQKWSLQPVDHLSWLPTGFRAPFAAVPPDYLDFANPLRYLLVYGAAAAAMLAAVVGIRSRRVLEALAAVLVVQGLATSVVCIAHTLSGSNKVLWFHFEQQFFLGAPLFPYKNQNATYQTLLTGAVLGICLKRWFADGFRPGRATLWATFAAMTCLLGLAAVRSRAGQGFAILLAVLFVGILWRGWSRTNGRPPIRWVLAGTILALVCAVPLLVKAGFGRTVSWLENEGSRAAFWPHGGEWRYYLHRISLEMAGDRPWLGWGGGCFVYLFPDYHGKVPELAASAYRSQPSLYRLIAVHGDGDWYEFLAEYGIIGCSLLLGAWVLLVVQVFRLGLGHRPEFWPVAAALVFAFLHGSIDLVLRNQAVIVLFAVLCVLLVRQCQFASIYRAEAPTCKDRPGIDSSRKTSKERRRRDSGERGRDDHSGRA